MLTVWGFFLGGGGVVLFFFGFFFFFCLFFFFFVFFIIFFLFLFYEVKSQKESFYQIHRRMDPLSANVMVSAFKLNGCKILIFLSDLSKYPFSLSWSFSAVLSLRLSTTLAELSLWLRTFFVQYFSKIFFKRVVWLEVL